MSVMEQKRLGRIHQQQSVMTSSQHGGKDTQGRSRILRPPCCTIKADWTSEAPIALQRTRATRARDNLEAVSSRVRS